MMKTARIVIACLLLCFASLAFLPAPHVFVWQLKLVATELGHWMVIAPLSVIAGSRLRSRLDIITTTIAVLAAALFLSSSVRAAWYASTAATIIDAEFPVPTDRNGCPFSIRRLWTFRTPTAVGVQTFDFAMNDDGPLKMDFFPAQDRRDAPCVVVIPGGGWDTCDRGGFAEMHRHLAQRGYAVASMDYRLAPRWKWPAQKEDVLSAVAYLRARSAELGIDSERFVLMGRSAGAQIAGAVAASGEHPEIVGCIMFYGPADMHFAAKYADPSDILDSDKLLRQFLGGMPAQFASSYDTASAYALASSRTPPTLLLHGETDELVWVRQSERYADRLLGLHVRHAFLRIPWATHGFDYVFNGPGGQLADWSVGRFLDSITSR